MTLTFDLHTPDSNVYKMLINLLSMLNLKDVAQMVKSQEGKQRKKTNRKKSNLGLKFNRGLSLVKLRTELHMV